MAGWKKILLGVVVAGAGLLVAGGLAVKIYVTPERVLNLVRSGLEKSLQRKVDVGAVDVGLFSGIHLTKLSIQTKDGESTLLSAENIELSYGFMALFRGELLLGQILIKDPQLRLVRETDGRLNIDDLFVGQSSRSEVSGSETGANPEDASGEIPILIKQFSLQGGTLQFIDRKLNNKSPYRYRLENLNVEIDNFSLNSSFPVRFAARINDASLAMELQVGVVDGLQTLKVHIDQLNLVPFLPYFQDVLPGNLGQGVLSTELEISKQPEGFITKGQVVLDKLDIRLDLDKPVHWNDVRVALDQDLLYRLSDQVVEIKKLNVDINGAQASYQGKVLLAEPLQVAGEVKVKVSDLRQLNDLIPLELRDQVEVYVVAGGLEASLQVQGQPVDLDVIQQATIKAVDIQASIGTLRPALNGTFEYSAGRVRGDQLRIDLNGQLLSVDLEATKKVSSLPYLELMVSSEELNLDTLFPSPPSQEKAAGSVGVANSTTGTSKSSKAQAKEPLNLPLSGRASVQFSKFLYQGLLFEKVQGQMLLNDGMFTLDRLTTDMAGGSATLNVEADFGKVQIPLRGHLDVTGVDLAALTGALFPKAHGSIKGTLIADSNFNGYGGTNDLLADLNASGDFDLKDGELKGSPLLAEFSQFLSSPELEVLGFSRLYGNYGLKKKQGTIVAKLESHRVSFAPQGSFSLDGPLNLSLETRISPGLMAKSRLGGKGAELLKDEDGWTLLPLKIKGTYSKPRLILDSSGVKKQIRKGMVNELGRQLQKKIGGDEQQNQQLQKLLEGTLKKLFGN